MSNKYSILALLAGAFLLVAFPNNPPNGYTGAPGEDTCNDCHSIGSGTQDGSVSLSGIPSVIIPNMAYVITVTSSNPNGVAELAGFQLTILDENNNKAGNITGTSSGSHTETSGGRQYWEHFPAQMFPGSNVVMWTATWTASNIPTDSEVTWYGASNIANGNGFSTGDLIVTTTGSGTQDGGGPNLSVLITSFTDVSCFNGNNGSATAQASGGQAPYTYSWSNGGSGATITNLQAGDYTVTATDNLGATATSSVEISEPVELELNSPQITHVTCNGGNNGSITANADGGTPPYFFQWSNGNNGTTINNLSAGPYTVTVTDDNNCTDVATYTVNQPSAITISLSNLDHESCAGLDDGTITIAVTGGDNPYFAEWSNSFIGLSISDLEPGVYTVTVTDDSDCTKTASYTINAGGSVDVSLQDIEHVTCNGGSNGSLSVSATGGVGPYTFEWSNGMSGSTITGLSAGTYLVTATDDLGCEVVEGYTINQPSAININISQAGQNSCFGDANVDLTANVSGGAPGYTALWSNGIVGLENDNLAAGSYTITVTDNSGCTKTATAVVTSPPLLNANVTTTDETSSGGNNGTATATPTGGTPGYTYLWSNGGTTSTITGLPPGTYTVTVTDASGCTATGSGQVDAFGCTIDVGLGPDATICDGDTLLISATVTGGIAPITYLWSNGATTSSIEVSSGGEYCVTATDASNCSDADCIIITQIVIPPLTCPVTNESAPGSNDGAINCDGNTGIASWLWSNGATTSSISGLAPGEYCVTVTDSNGCTLVQCFNVQPGNCNMIVTPTVVNVACNGDTTGSISLSVTGGTAPISFAWSTGGTSSSINNLGAGNYAATVSDAAGCVENLSFAITESSAIVITVDSVAPINQQGNGAIQVSVSGGTPPYTYVWTDPLGANYTTEDISNLTEPGNYDLLVTDAENCTAGVDSIFVDLDVAVDPTPYFATVKVYPVPVEDVLTVRLDRALTEVFITGVDGRLYQHIKNPASNKLDVKELQAGWYILRMTDGENWYVARMVK